LIIVNPSFSSSSIRCTIYSTMASCPAGKFITIRRHDMLIFAVYWAAV
jgi:hypothetical protein